MPGNQDLTYNVTGQSLYLDVPEGLPTSVTSVSVLGWDASDDSTAESATTGSASIDSVSTTFDANSGRSSVNTRLLNLAATTGLVAGRTYLATDAQGRMEWPKITGITSGATATAVHGLGLDYVSGDTLVGTRISISVSDTWIADASKINVGTNTFDRWRVRWVYVVGGVTYVRTTTASVVRKAGQHNVNPSDFRVRFPSLANMVQRDFRDERIQLIIDRAYDEFSTDLISANVADEQVLSPKIVDEMVELKTAVMIGQDQAMAGGDIQMMEVAERIYAQRFEGIFAAPSRVKVPVSTDSTGAGDSVAPVGLSVR